MKLRHYKRSKDINRIFLPGLLMLLGFTHKEVRRRKNHSEPSLFYRKYDRRNEWALREIYWQAYSKYRHRIKQVHPDHGGSQEECAVVNRIWERIKYLLKLRGLKEP